MKILTFPVCCHLKHLWLVMLFVIAIITSSQATVAPLVREAASLVVKPSSVASVPYSGNERREQKQLWREIRKSCEGSWSGALAVYDVGKENEMSMKRQPLLNFRLHCQTKGREGTWTVWNLAKEGDEITVPLRMRPMDRSSVLKVSFEGIIIRFPYATTGPQIAFEVGFWDKLMRRTVVNVYKAKEKKKSWMPGWLYSSSSSDDNSKDDMRIDLDEVTLIQSERQSSRGFVGNCTEPTHIDILPTESTCQTIDHINWSAWQPVKSESVNIEAWERSTIRLKKRMKSEDTFPFQTRNQVHEHVVNAFGASDPLTFVRTLPIGISASLPYQLSSEEDQFHAVFVHQWNEKEVVVVDLHYRGQVAKSATLYTFRYTG